MDWKLKKYFINLNPLKDRIPWMVYDSIFWLDKYLKKDMKIFEWGSGGSTLFFIKKEVKLISVEHDKKWYKTIKPMTVTYKDIIYKLLPPSKGKVFRSSAAEYKDLSFEKYCRQISSYEDNSFDLVCVDGRARNDCIKLALKKVRLGGYLILDNSERDIYAKGIYSLRKWNRKDFFGKGPINKYPWKTSIFQKTSV